MAINQRAWHMQFPHLLFSPPLYYGFLSFFFDWQEFNSIDKETKPCAQDNEHKGS